MTEEQLRTERAMRWQVFRNKPDQQKTKIAEMDRLMAILVALKDELKPHTEPVYQQPPLIDVPRRTEYN